MTRKNLKARAKESLNKKVLGPNQRIWNQDLKSKSVNSKASSKNKSKDARKTNSKSKSKGKK